MGEHYTMVHDRFQVGDDCCGHVSGHLTKREAEAARQRHQERHDNENGFSIKVWVWDAMAHKGKDNAGN
jgi:hypothetical protein